MQSIPLPYLNIALDAFALVITLIILMTCISGFSKKVGGARYFLLLQCSVVVALIADIVGWIGEGNIALSYLTMAANTVASCACQIVIICFIGYLISSLYANSRAAAIILKLMQFFCALSLLFCIGNAFFGYAFWVDANGHYVHSSNAAICLVYLLFPIVSFFVIVMLSIFAKSSTKVSRVAFICYTLFPVAGLILDFTFHGISLTYAGFTVAVLSMYTGIYINRRKQLEAQKNALMLSQINPHFVYNTLSTIASMCDTSPKQAKYLTIDFSQYLRRNIGTLTSEELIPFEQEMDHVACYLKIEKARFRERINVVYSIQCKDFSLPPLTVQPIVENAVKHGVTKRAEGGTVKVCSYDNDTHYIIEVIDDGVGFDTEKTDMHVGIENARSRIAAMCKGDLTVKSTVGVGTRVTIEIPKKKGKRK